MPNTPSFLVIGNAVTETVTRTEDGAVRAHAGGVGAIMARELALAGADVTLLTTALPGPSLDDVRHHLAKAGAKLDANTGDPPQRMHGQVHIRCRRGEFAGASGEWVRMGGLGRRIAETAPNQDMVLVSMNLMPGDLQTALKNSRRLIANATSPKLASRLIRLKGLTAATLNSREMGALSPHFRKKPKAGDMPSLLAAETVLLTKGARGMSLYTPDTVSDVAAPPVPAGTDFVGAGDAATAGLAWALANGLDPLDTAAAFVRAILDRNARSYRLP